MSVRIDEACVRDRCKCFDVDRRRFASGATYSQSVRTVVATEDQEVRGDGESDKNVQHF